MNSAHNIHTNTGTRAHKTDEIRKELNEAVNVVLHVSVINMQHIYEHISIRCVA